MILLNEVIFLYCIYFWNTKICLFEWLSASKESRLIMIIQGQGSPVA